MATFINKKEQVIEFQLTPYGKHKFSKGSLSPKYYSFYDDDILYDFQYNPSGSLQKDFENNPKTGNESQNDIVSRIKDTQRISLTTNFQDLMQNNSVGVVSVDTLLGEFNQLASSRERTYVTNFQRPIGSNSPWKNYMPAWRFSSISGSSIISPVTYISGAIPRITGTLNIEYSTGQRSSFNYQTRRYEDQNFYILEKSDRFLLDIEELNTISKMNGNFEIEVYKMSEGGEEEITKLNFINPDSREAIDLRSQQDPEVYSQFLNGTDDVLEESFSRLDETYVEYYLSIRVDDEIDEPGVPVSPYRRQQPLSINSTCD